MKARLTSARERRDSAQEKRSAFGSLAREALVQGVHRHTRYTRYPSAEGAKEVFSLAPSARLSRLCVFRHPSAEGAKEGLLSGPPKQHELRKQGAQYNIKSKASAEFLTPLGVFRHPQALVER